MSANLSRIASDVGGIPEVLDGGRAGLLVPPGAPARLAEALSTLLSDPKALAHWRVMAGRGLEWLDVRRVAEETVEVYRRALGVVRERREMPAAAMPDAGRPAARS